jgi:hypothetical protein
MKYLQKSFSLSMHIPRQRSIFEKLMNPTPARPEPKPGHKYTPGFGGMCNDCMLDKIGHQQKFGKK